MIDALVIITTKGRLVYAAHRTPHAPADLTPFLTAVVFAPAKPLAPCVVGRAVFYYELHADCWCVAVVSSTGTVDAAALGVFVGLLAQHFEINSVNVAAHLLEIDRLWLDFSLLGAPHIPPPFVIPPRLSSTHIVAHLDIASHALSPFAPAFPAPPPSSALSLFPPPAFARIDATTNTPPPPLPPAAGVVVHQREVVSVAFSPAGVAADAVVHGTLTVAAAPGTGTTQFVVDAADACSAFAVAAPCTGTARDGVVSVPPFTGTRVAVTYEAPLKTYPLTLQARTSADDTSRPRR